MANAYEQHDISDESWAKINFLLPGCKGTWRGNARDKRQFLNVVFGILRTGEPWCNAPRFSKAALRRNSQKMKISFFENPLRRPILSHTADAVFLTTALHVPCLSLR